MSDEGLEPFDQPDAICLDHSDKAVKVLFDGQVCWIPQSVVHEDSEVYRKGDEGTLVVHMWFARKQGWI